MKNDLADATLLADLLRMNRLPEAWIAPDSIRQLRELVRYRHKLSQMRTGLKGQVHSVMGKEGVIPTLSELWGPAGTVYLDSLDLADAYAVRVDSLRELIDVFDHPCVSGCAGSSKAPTVGYPTTASSDATPTGEHDTDTPNSASSPPSSSPPNSSTGETNGAQNHALSARPLSQKPQDRIDTVRLGGRL